MFTQAGTSQALVNSIAYMPRRALAPKSCTTYKTMTALRSTLRGQRREGDFQGDTHDMVDSQREEERDGGKAAFRTMETKTSYSQKNTNRLPLCAPATSLSICLSCEPGSALTRTSSSNVRHVRCSRATAITLQGCRLHPTSW